ncbi:type II CRISPR-associated endonuclease Cas1 [Thioalkalivibrio sp. HK1]|uniref:type II CRISPR-associated endonuclease Cas1 n=1 Tax=Thioalkalivibrio sp. HK1 TaxID=1469245 RepID=UPI00047249F8|nr:type II CRISPR-associated endonuclease Cas1 [Thioalkalivibrio sp. HK1]
MVGQIVEITKPGCYLRKHRGFMEVSENSEVIGQVPLDDIGSVIISVLGCSVSTALINELAELNIPLVMCGSNYLPTSMTLPVAGYGRQLHVMQAQINMSEPRRKRLWQRIVRGKIKNQAAVIKSIGESNERLLRLAASVRSGDTGNAEAQAARDYWRRLFGKGFRRNRENVDPLNTSLNYIYAIVRSCVARGISSAGLHPCFSLHHKNPQNPINLVDDLMEPYRPIADYFLSLRVNLLSGRLTPEAKSELAAITNLPIPQGEEEPPLSLAAAKMCRQVARYYQEEVSEVVLPELPYPLQAMAG